MTYAIEEDYGPVTRLWDCPGLTWMEAVQTAALWRSWGIICRVVQVEEKK